jgi:hypothetical protein
MTTPICDPSKPFLCWFFSARDKTEFPDLDKPHDYAKSPRGAKFLASDFWAGTSRIFLHERGSKRVEVWDRTSPMGGPGRWRLADVWVQVYQLEKLAGGQVRFQEDAKFWVKEPVNPVQIPVR